MKKFIYSKTGGGKCPHCKKFNKETEGSSVTFMNGNSRFYCSYCGKASKLSSIKK